MTTINITNHFDQSPVIVNITPVPGSLDPTWAVTTLLGEHLGYVARGERTWERRGKGRRYVNARGTVVAWYIGHRPHVSVTGYPYDTRKEACQALLRQQPLEERR